MWVYRAAVLWTLWAIGIIFCSTAPWYDISFLVIIFSVVGALECLFAVYLSVLYARPGLLPGSAQLAPNPRERGEILKEAWYMLAFGVIWAALSNTMLRSVRITLLPLALCWVVGAVVLLVVVYGTHEAPQPLAPGLP